MRKRIQIEYFGIFLFLVVLCALFPWCSDDWTWGSIKGIELLSTGFKDYNGRYLGNLLVLALTRSRLLRAVFMAVTHTCLLFVLSGLTGEFEGRLAMISAVLFLMPAGMFAQAIAWTSGFTNYVPSIVISLVYIYLVRDIFDSREPQYRRGSALIFLALGAAGSLFIEHVTIYNICLGIFVLVYTRIRFKRVYKPHIAFLVGAVVGAAVMFTNGAYRAVSQGTDWYRSIGHGITGMLVRAWWNAVETVIPYGFRGSCGLMIALCIAACMASSAFHEEINKKWAAWHETAKTIIIFYTAIVIIENVGNVSFIWEWKSIELIVTVAYLLAWVVFLFTLPVGTENKAKLLFYLGSAVILIGCILIVTPIGPRCLFASYVFFCLLAMALLSVSVQSGRIKLRMAKEIIAICVVAFSLFYVNIYGTVALFEHARVEKIQQDLAQGETTLSIKNMVYGEYVWRADPIKGTVLEEPFKAFYGIDEAIGIENVN